MRIIYSWMSTVRLWTIRLWLTSAKVSRQIYAVPDLCCIMSRRLVELVGGVFDPLLSSAIAVFEHVKDELAVILCLLLATL